MPKPRGARGPKAAPALAPTSMSTGPSALALVGNATMATARPVAARKKDVRPIRAASHRTPFKSIAYSEHEFSHMGLRLQRMFHLPAPWLAPRDISPIFFAVAMD